MADRTWTADEVREKLRRRYPATQRMGALVVPGPWTCIDEWRNIDLLAFCATRASRVPYARIGHEIKVSRGDYRSELRNPDKRAEAVAACHEFYFVVPRGLLRDDELPGGDAAPQLGERSLYVPDDVGLIVVDGRGSHVIKDSPIRRDPEPIVREARPGGPVAFDVAAFARWVSARPDPRHDGLVEEARRRGREIAALHRERKARLRQPLAATPQQGSGEQGGERG